MFNYYLSKIHCGDCGMLFTATATDREYCEMRDLLKDNTEAYKFFNPVCILWCHNCNANKVFIL